MAHYIEVSSKIYGIYLKYIAPEDIHVYSIDEVFMDVTAYLGSYKLTAHELAMKMIRDAQFAPFAAVAGHDAAIREERLRVGDGTSGMGRITDSWTELGDTGNDELNRKMEQVITLLPQHPTVTIEYFLPDSNKSGGSYQAASGQVKRVDEYERMIELMDGRKIAIDMVKDIQGLG